MSPLRERIRYHERKDGYYAALNFVQDTLVSYKAMPPIADAQARRDWDMQTLAVQSLYQALCDNLRSACDLD